MIYIAAGYLLVATIGAVLAHRFFFPIEPIPLVPYEIGIAVILVALVGGLAWYFRKRLKRKIWLVSLGIAGSFSNAVLLPILINGVFDRSPEVKIIVPTQMVDGKRYVELVGMSARGVRFPLNFPDAAKSPQKNEKVAIWKKSGFLGAPWIVSYELFPEDFPIDPESLPINPEVDED